jgi:transcriptional regulator with XRE-family HTH domain
MDLLRIGERIRKQRESLGYSRDTFSELLDITPKFCSDIELGIKGMSVKTLMRVSQTLKIPTDYILFGTPVSVTASSVALTLQSCDPKVLPYLEQLVNTFLTAIDSVNNKQ